MNGVTLASLRNRRNLTQRELARELNISSSAIAMYETGERTPSLKKAKKIARYFDVSVDVIIFGPLAREVQANTNNDQAAALVIKVADDEQAAALERAV